MVSRNPLSVPVSTEFLTVVLLKIRVFWYVYVYQLGYRYWHFKGLQCLLLGVVVKEVCTT